MPPRPRLFTRDFALLAGLTFLTFFAAFQLFPTAPLELRRLGASLGESGRFMAAFTAGSSLGALVTGPLGDRLGSKRMVVACSAGFGLLLGAYGLLPARWCFYALAFPQGVVWSGLLTATSATLGRVLPPARRADGMSLFGLASPAGVVFGPMVGLAVHQRWGFTPMVGGLCLLFLVLALLAGSLPADPPGREARPALRPPGKELAAPALVLLATALGYGTLGTYTAQEALALGFPELLGVPTASAFLTCMAIGMVAMRLFMTLAGFGEHPTRLLPAMLWATVTGLGMLALLPGGLVRHVAAALLYGGGYGMVHTLVNTHLLETIPADRRGAAFGTTLFAFDAGIGLGSLAIGALIGWSCGRAGLLGYRFGWLLAAALALAAVPLSYRLVQAGPAPPAEPRK
jgi:MFS family permease